MKNRPVLLESSTSITSTVNLCKLRKSFGSLKKETNLLAQSITDFQNEILFDFIKVMRKDSI